MTTTRFQDLEKQIQTLQEEHKKQVQKLQEEIDRLKKEEQETKLPKDFNRESVINFLNTFKPSFLGGGFTWNDTPQGHDYWNEIHSHLVTNHNPSYKVPEEAIIQLQKWVKEEQKTELPHRFERELVINFLNTPNHRDILHAFNWSDTPQGSVYWDKIYRHLIPNHNPSYKVPEEAIIQLQKWVIMSYQQQYGN